jgi:hypothetical protein
LLRAGANPNYHTVGGTGGFSAIFVVAGYVKQPEYLRLLLKYGGDPNDVVNDSIDTSLTRALDAGVETENWTNYYILLDAGADINREHGGQTIAERAVALDQFDKAKELLQRGYSHNLERLGHLVGSTYLGHLSDGQRKDRLQVVELLRQRGVKVEDTAER